MLLKSQAGYQWNDDIVVGSISISRHPQIIANCRVTTASSARFSLLMSPIQRIKAAWKGSDGSEAVAIAWAREHGVGYDSINSIVQCNLQCTRAQTVSQALHPDWR